MFEFGYQAMLHLSMAIETIKFQKFFDRSLVLGTDDVLVNPSEIKSSVVPHEQMQRIYEDAKKVAKEGTPAAQKLLEVATPILLKATLSGLEAQSHKKSQESKKFRETITSKEAELAQLQAKKDPTTENDLNLEKELKGVRFKLAGAKRDLKFTENEEKNLSKHISQVRERGCGSEQDTRQLASTVDADQYTHKFEKKLKDIHFIDKNTGHGTEVKLRQTNGLHALANQTNYAALINYLEYMMQTQKLNPADIMLPIDVDGTISALGQKPDHQKVPQDEYLRGGADSREFFEYLKKRGIAWYGVSGRADKVGAKGVITSVSAAGLLADTSDCKTLQVQGKQEYHPTVTPLSLNLSSGETCEGCSLVKCGNIISVDRGGTAYNKELSIEAIIKTEYVDKGKKKPKVIMHIDDSAQYLMGAYDYFHGDGKQAGTRYVGVLAWPQKAEAPHYLNWATYGQIRNSQNPHYSANQATACGLETKQPSSELIEKVLTPVNKVLEEVH